MTEKMMLRHRDGHAEQEPYHFTECGLANVWLDSGFERREIGGEECVSVHDGEDLHRAIALAILERGPAFDGAQVRFLRNELDATQTELGNLLGVDAQTVARWEKGQHAITGPAARLLALLVLTHYAIPQGMMDYVKEMATRDTDTRPLHLAHTGTEWRAA